MDNQPSTGRSSNPLHIIASEPRQPRAETLLALHADLARVEQNVFNLLHPKAPRSERRRKPSFIITEESFDLTAGLVPSANPMAVSTLSPWTPWMPESEGVRAE